MVFANSLRIVFRACAPNKSVIEVVQHVFGDLRHRKKQSNPTMTEAIRILRTERQAALIEVPLLSEDSTTGSLNSGVFDIENTSDGIRVVYILTSPLRFV
uniref:AlNc14C20G2104 protein n=1 Tax=Albugo laibachii Nc14 TaxID=890382 RepID=F0W5D8_9STRA|nr:AlNc14C20G2104 [Albugo laibachii Nc14]|eukprot:CCA16329.1 AlNc14C20G2104 [Albugo laibachii Nc14]